MCIRDRYQRRVHGDSINPYSLKPLTHIQGYVQAHHRNFRALRFRSAMTVLQVKHVRKDHLIMILALLCCAFYNKKLYRKFVHFLTLFSHEEHASGQTEKKRRRVSVTRVISFCFCIISFWSFIFFAMKLLKLNKDLSHIKSNKNARGIFTEFLLKVLPARWISNSDAMTYARIMDPVPRDLFDNLDLKKKPFKLVPLICGKHIINMQLDNSLIKDYLAGRIQPKDKDGVVLRMLSKSWNAFVSASLFVPRAYRWVFRPKIIDLSIFEKGEQGLITDLFVCGQSKTMVDSIMIEKLKLITADLEVLKTYIKRLMLSNGVLSAVSLAIFAYTVRAFIYRQSDGHHSSKLHTHHGVTFKEHHIPTDREEYRPNANYHSGLKLTRTFLERNKINLMLMTCECEKYFKNILFKDCHHCVFCFNCYMRQKPKNCPLCKSAVKGYISVHYA
eukprot:TRINITY_DN9334_c0_g1_i2.p1 TRINITY_DN9334_c0_g1~~TRINITY_DN9334_c0_g1_i2.p1  ORF type:complete len:485 (-),score=91.78 TRINITY_DN9334_c0_g1_i2:296-1630(-)